MYNTLGKQIAANPYYKYMFLYVVFASHIASTALKSISQNDCRNYICVLFTKIIFALYIYM